MKKNEIAIGGTYLAKVSDRLVAVRIDREHSGGGGWDATNLTTNKKVRIKSAQRLRGLAASGTPGTPGTAGAAVGAAGAEVATIPGTPTPQRNTGQRGATGGKRRAKAVGGSGETGAGVSGDASGGASGARGMSGLDAAAQVLKDAGTPLRCKDMVETMLAMGLWKTGGKTPAATIYAAILREINTKGEASRFQKTARGFFTYRGN